MPPSATGTRRKLIDCVRSTLCRSRNAEQLRTFAYALRHHLDGRPQTWLATELGISAQALNEWLSEKKPTEPRREHVFLAETGLDLPPGTLSATLGYLPDTRIGVEQAIASAPELAEAERSALLDIYAVARSRSRVPVSSAAPTKPRRDPSEPPPLPRPATADPARPSHPVEPISTPLDRS